MKKLTLSFTFFTGITMATFAQNTNAEKSASMIPVQENSNNNANPGAVNVVTSSQQNNFKKDRKTDPTTTVVKTPAPVKLNTEKSKTEPAVKEIKKTTEVKKVENPSSPTEKPAQLSTVPR